MMNEAIFRAMWNAYPYPIVYCSRDHVIRWMNAAAELRYAGMTAVGESIFKCHNSASCAKIEAFLARADAGEGEMFEALLSGGNGRTFFTPVRAEDGMVCGYFERKEMLWTEAEPSAPVIVKPMRP